MSPLNTEVKSHLLVASVVTCCNSNFKILKLIRYQKF